MYSCKLTVGHTSKPAFMELSVQAEQAERLESTSVKQQGGAGMKISLEGRSKEDI